MKTAYIFLADGCGEVEALTVVDILRRGKVDIKTVSITDKLQIISSHNITFNADMIIDDIKEKADMIILPGGIPGTPNLAACDKLTNMINEYNEEGRYLAAVCAAPSVYGNMGLLKGRKATCYPGYEDKLLGATPVTDKVVVDGHFITSRGMGTCVDFGLKLLEILEDSDVSESIAKKIIYR